MITGLFGYDESLVRRMPARERARIERRAWACVPALATCGASAAYGTWLATGEVLTAFGAAAFAVLFVWNLLRLVVSATGVPVDESPEGAEEWRPGTAPLLVFTVFAIIAAQPPLLLVLHGELEPEITSYRSELARLHEHARLDPITDRRADLATQQAELARRIADDEARLARVREAPDDDTTARDLRAEAERNLEFLRGAKDQVETALATTEQELARVRAEDVDEYVAHLGTMHFPVRRLSLAWERPLRSASISAVFALLALLPLLLRRFGRRALLPYELLRHETHQHAVVSDHATWVAEMDRITPGFPRWRPLPGPFGEPPTGTLLARPVRRVPGRELLDRLPGSGGAK